VQPVRVKVVSSRVDEPWDVITLKHSNVSQGSFTGVINVSAAVIPGAQDDGIVRLQPGDFLQIIYTPALFLIARDPIALHVRTWINARLRLEPAPAAAVGPTLNLPARDVSLVPLDDALAIELTDVDQNVNVLAAGHVLFVAKLLSSRRRTLELSSHRLNPLPPPPPSPSPLPALPRIWSSSDHVTVALTMRNGSSLNAALILRETGLSTGIFTARVPHPGLDAASQVLVHVWVQEIYELV